MYKIDRLSLLSSFGCNLNCKYCEVAKNKQSLDLSNSIQKKTIESFQNGFFLKNVREVLKKLNQDESQILSINLWGQEPTLTLKYFGDHIDDWLNVFYNCKEIFFSTNGGTDPDIIFNFIKILDKNLKSSFNLRIQYSYDGIWACENERGISSDLIKNNYKNLIEKLNTITLSHLKIYFFIHGVLSLDFIQKFYNDKEMITAFSIDFNETEKLFSSIITNNNIKFLNSGLELQHPCDGSSLDGKKLYFFIQQLKLINSELNIDINKKIFKQLKFHIHQIDYLNNKNFEFQLSDILNKSLNHNNYQIDKTKSIKFGMSCGVYTKEYKIMYDGTLLDCLNNIYSFDKNYLNPIDEIKKEKQLNAINHGFFINPLIEEDLNKINNIYNIYTILENSFISTYQAVVNLMNLLYKTQQIDISYQNKQKLLYHAFIITKIYSCHYDNIEKSNSHYLRYTGIIRLLCNGFLDEFDKYLITIKDFINE